MICVCLGITQIYKFPLIISLTTGLSIPGDVIGWGDWYVGAYFWNSLLFIGLFSKDIRQGFIWTAILVYITVCLKYHGPDDGWMKTYYSLIGNQFIRGTYSMGLGIFASFLADKIKISNKSSVHFIFSIIEIYFLFMIFNYIIRSSHMNLMFFEMEIIVVLLLICIANSLGYLTGYLNKVSKIQFISRYTYSIFLGHIPFIRYLTSHQNFGLNQITCSIIIMVGAIILGIFEYHIIEKRIVPWIIHYFKKEVS